MNVLQNLQMFFAGYNTPGATTLENYDVVRGTSVEVDAVDWPIRICRTDHLSDGARVEQCGTQIRKLKKPPGFK